MNQAVIVARTAITRDFSAALKRAAVVAAQSLLLGASYYLTINLGLGFRFQNTQIGVVWPSTALVVSALLLVPRSRWWWVLAVVIPVHVAVMVDQVPAWRWTWQIVGNSAFQLCTAEIMRRVAGMPLTFGSRRQVFAFTDYLPPPNVRC